MTLTLRISGDAIQLGVHLDNCSIDDSSPFCEGGILILKKYKKTCTNLPVTLIADTEAKNIVENSKRVIKVAIFHSPGLVKAVESEKMRRGTAPLLL